MTSRSLPKLSLATRYVLDANILIASWRDYYPIDLYPGFWACLERFGHEKQLLILDKAREEVKGPPELVAWLRRKWPGGIVSTRDLNVGKAFSQIQSWVQSNNQFLSAAKHEFARKADGWLVAHAKVHSVTLVTNEVYNEEVRRRVPLPNLCRKFGVEVCNTIGMLRGLGVAFDLRVL